MTITYSKRPLTADETAAGWQVVLVPNVGLLNPVYLAHADDLDTFLESPMVAMLERVLNAKICVEYDAK